MEPLTVLTLNAYLCRFYGVDLASSIDERAELIAAALGRLQPDVVCLQEVWDPKLVPRLLEGLPEHRPVFGPLASLGRPLGSGLVTATRVPLLRTAFHPIRSTRRLKEILAQRGVLICELDWEGTEFTVANLHLGVGWRWAQRRQHQQALDAIRRVTGPAAVCGDMNIPAVEAYPQAGLTVQELPRLGWRDAVREVHGLASTIMLSVDDRNPLVRRGFRRRIDYIWLRPGDARRLAVRDARVVLNEPVGGIYASDHFGVIARFSIEE